MTIDLGEHLKQAQIERLKNLDEFMRQDFIKEMKNNEFVERRFLNEVKRCE